MRLNKYAVCAAVFFLVATMFGCASDGQGPIVIVGQVSEVEASIIRVAVGAAMSAMPQAVAPAYAVSTALLQAPTLDSVIFLANLDDRIAAEVKKLKLTKDEKVMFFELVGAIKSGIKERLGDLTELDGFDYSLVVKTVIQIVNDAAKARLV
jgi:hypothetical protein